MVFGLDRPCQAGAGIGLSLSPQGGAVEVGAVRPARRGSLDGPGLGMAASHIGAGARQGLLAAYLAGTASDLTIAHELGGQAVGPGCLTFLRPVL